MGLFLSDLDLRVIEDAGPRPVVELIAPLHYLSGDGSLTSPRLDVIVPVGYRCDLASVPSGMVGGLAAMGGIVPTTGMRAAVVHDWLLDSGIVPRRQADLIYRDALAACAVDPDRADTMYRAVSVRTAQLEYDANRPDPLPEGLTGA